MGCTFTQLKTTVIRKPFSELTQEIIMLLEINNKDTSPSSRSVRFPDLQIFVEILHTNLQSPACLEYGASIKVPPKGHQHRITRVGH